MRVVVAWGVVSRCHEGWPIAVDFLEAPTRGDPSLILAEQLFAVKLNIENGSEPTPVSAEVADADAAYAALSEKLPYEVRASTLEGQ